MAIAANPSKLSPIVEFDLSSSHDQAANRPQKSHRNGKSAHKKAPEAHLKAYEDGATRTETKKENFEHSYAGTVAAGPPIAKRTSAETLAPREKTKTYRRAPDHRKPSLCVFVASLPALLADEELCRQVSDHFSVFGDIASVKVLRDPANRPYAFVQYTNDADCRTAIELGHDSELGGRRLRCEAAKVNRTLFFSFSEALDQAQVLKLVEKFGETDLVKPGTESGRLASSEAVTKSHNWFVKFTYRDEAIQAFAKLSDSDHFQAEWAQNIDDAPTPGANFDRNSIFVGQLPKNVSTDSLRSHFSEHGYIESINVVRRPDSNFAFITFSDEFAAASAVSRDNHALFLNKTIHVKYKLSAPKKSTRVILSPRVPVALAPPPVHQRNRYTESYNKWSRTIDKGSGSSGERSPGVFGDSGTDRDFGSDKVCARSSIQATDTSIEGVDRIPHRSKSRSSVSLGRYYIIPRSD